MRAAIATVRMLRLVWALADSPIRSHVVAQKTLASSIVADPTFYDIM